METKTREDSNCCCCCCQGNGPVQALLQLYCRMRCRGKLVAAALSFHPPSPSFYNLQTAPTSSSPVQQPRHQIVFDECLGPVSSTISRPDVYVLPCKKSRSVVTVAIYPRPAPDFVLLYSHGNATDIGAMHSILSMLSTRCNATVVCYDYSGYGSSTGVPSEAGTYANIQTVYKFLLVQKIVTNPTKELVCYGESIGSGPSIWLCSRVSLAGLILQSAIASGLRVLTDNRLLCCCDIFPNLDRIKKVKCLTFVMHGASDEQVGIHHGTRLHASLPTKHAYTPWWVDGAGHNNLRQVAGEEYIQRMNNFLKRVKDEKQTEKQTSNMVAAHVGAEKTVVAGEDKECAQSFFPVAGQSKTSAVVYPEQMSS